MIKSPTNTLGGLKGKTNAIKTVNHSSGIAGLGGLSRGNKFGLGKLGMDNASKMLNKSSTAPSLQSSLLKKNK